ncbi:hypothetical protein M0R45_027214 [Rubus argutus]|uniref:TIR domain-containing protein n=1 Tax=Rubus argutus TaxID=59490 RepID=A0AAW1X2B7_RUBAR
MASKIWVYDLLSWWRGKPKVASSSTRISSGSESESWVYDVFLSFRGEDTRYQFTDHLYTALNRAGIKSYRDSEGLGKGEVLAASLINAIQGSRICLIVFSENYADSRWCLDELVHIIKCRDTLGQMVVPIFYRVNPSDVRRQTGTFAAAFQKHEARRHDIGTYRISTWRTALTEAGNLSGWHPMSNWSEAEFIKIIVDDISERLNNTYLHVALHPVGIDSRLQDIIRLGVKLDDDVRLVGIWGMGGSGKTTLAKAIYKEYYHEFEGKSFLANVRETAKKSNGMINLQERLLSDILKPTEVKVGDADRGVIVIQQRLKSKKVLVIVDDVDEVDQLSALAIWHSSFGPGSRIIITTRDRHLLEILQVDTIYLTREMEEEEALELFSWHAFHNPCPDAEFLQLSRSVCTYCRGLPLALEVLGSLLFQRSVQQWKSTLDKLEKYPNDKIQKVLRISFDALDKNQKAIFLHISCFFIGMDKNYVTKILDGCGLFAEIDISVLLQRCLVIVGEKNKLMMHDLLRDMGREVVREESYDDPEERSRLWCREDIIDVLTEESGTKKIEGLALNLQRTNKKSFRTKAFTMMQKLKLLQLNYVKLTGDYDHLSKNLSWLCWHGFSKKFIGNDFLYQGNLVSMDLRYSNLVQVWEHPTLLGKLKILNLSHSPYLTQSPDLSKLPNLEFENLVEDIGDMASLTTLVVSGTAISRVPSCMGRLKNLNYSSVQGLVRLKLRFPEVPKNYFPAQYYTSLTYLDIESSSVHNLAELCGLSHLERPCFNNCKNLPASGDLPTRSKELESDHCTALELSKQSMIQGWTASRDGGICLPANDFPLQFAYVRESDHVFFQVPQIFGCNLKAFTVSVVCFPCFDQDISPSGISIFCTNHTKDIRFTVQQTHLTERTAHEVIWRVNLSNNEFYLEDDDFVEVEVVIGSGFRVKKTGVILVWDPKHINENTTECEPIPYEYLTSDTDKEAGPSHVSTDGDRPSERWRALMQEQPMSPQNASSTETKGHKQNHKSSKPESATSFQDDNSFVSEFYNYKLSLVASNSKSGKEELETEVERLKEQLKQANIEKAEITSKFEKLTSKFEKLSATCRSQRQELQELKQTLAARTPSPNKDALRNQTSPGVQTSATPPQREKIEGKLQQDKCDWKTPSPETKSRQAFAKSLQLTSTENIVKSVRTRNGHQSKRATTQLKKWAVESKPASQPAGWAGF